MQNPIIIALDFSKRETVDEFLNRFPCENLFVKVGMELFYQNGPALIDDLKTRGCRIFSDLKVHDIPTTVQKTMKGLASLNVDLVTVHASGGRPMMEAALEGLDQGTSSGCDRPCCIAVTQLTSTSEQMMQQDLLIPGKLEEVVASYAKLTESSGLDGVVCSPWETPLIKKTCRDDFMTVTPGIRLAEDQANDQTRFTTPKHARLLGSDFIVVGRSITEAKDPVRAYEQIKTEWGEADEQAHCPTLT